MNLEGNLTSKQALQGDLSAQYGTRGLSAYEVALSFGFEGTEEEWLASLQGKKGDKGDKGEQGIQGIQGVQGLKGDKGDKGEAGIDEEQLYKLAIISTTDKAPFHHITDSANMKVLDFGMEGKTEQETTSGKNLLPIDTLYVDGSGRVKTAEFTLEAGTYMLNSVDRTVLGVIVDNITDGGTLTNGWADTRYTSFSIDSSKTITVRFYTDDISLIDGNWMLTKGNTVDTTYEPYTGGVPSPNPDYPQEIVNAGVYNEETGRYEHKCYVENVNIFDVNEYPFDESGFWNVLQGTHSSNSSFRRTMKYTPISAYQGQSLYLYPNTGSINTGLCFYDKNYNFISGHSSIRTYGVVVPDNAHYIRLGYHKDDIENVVVSLNPVTSYIPHASQPLTLTSPVPLTKWDKLIKRDGVWGWSMYQLHLTVGESGNWVYHPGLGCFYLECLSKPMTQHTGFCNQLKVITGERIGDNLLYIGNSNKLILVYNTKFHDETLSDGGLANWKAHLAENPLEIWTYADEEQSFHPLPDEEQTLLNNLETYYGVTNLYNDQGCQMWLEYMADTKCYIDNKFKEMTSAIAQLL